jgi:hypothetical protein
VSKTALFILKRVIGAPAPNKPAWPMRAHNIRNLDSSLGARQHVRCALTTLFNLKRVVQREKKGQSGLIKGFYPQQTSLVAYRVRRTYYLRRCDGRLFTRPFYRVSLSFCSRCTLYTTLKYTVNHLGSSMLSTTSKVATLRYSRSILLREPN